MDKTKSSKFADLVRSFVSKGGTVIALAHTNKNRGADGRPQYGGTSDIISDFDCAYIMSSTAVEGEPDIKLVEFRNEKSRGPVEKLAYVKYFDGSQVPYAEKLASVRHVPEADLAEMKRKAQLARDSEVIRAISACIADGTDKKTDIGKEVRESTDVSRSVVYRVLDAHTGTDKQRHLWSVRIGPRGAKIYTLLAPAVVAFNPDDF